MSEGLQGAGQGHTRIQYEVPHVCAAIDAWLHKHMPASLDCMSTSDPARFAASQPMHACVQAHCPDKTIHGASDTPQSTHKVMLMYEQHFLDRNGTAPWA